MIEMSTGIGGTAMGIGVSHGSESSEGGNCRLRQSTTQASGTSRQQPSGDPQRPSQQQTSQQLQQVTQHQQQQEQRRRGMGIAGRSKKDNCCLCWCCCCSCSWNKCLAAVRTGTVVGGDQGSRRRGDNVQGGGLTDDFLAGNAENGFDSLDGLDDAIECCSLEEIRDWGSSFDHLMKSPAGRKLFREFLVREWSAENIAFWLACEQLRHESDPEKIEEKARYIYDNYISILSPKEVSLDSRVREIVNRNMVEPSPHTFDEAQLQIYTLMHRDSYPRFVNSELYRKVARLGSDPPSPTNDEEQQEQSSTIEKPKFKKSTT